MSQVLELLALQDIDDESAALRAALSLVDQRLRGDADLDAARRTLIETEQEIANISRAQRRAEGEAERLTAKIVPEESRLYDGSVKNPKELVNIQHEVAALREQRELFEVEMLEHMARLETLDRERQKALKLVAELEDRWEKTVGELKHELRRLGDALARADVKRELQKAKTNPRAVLVYEDLRRRKGGNAVTRIRGGICQGCRIGLPEGLRRRAFNADALTQCPNCERILAMG